MVIRHRYFWLTNHFQIAWLPLTLFHLCLHICQPSDPPTTVSTQITWLLTNPLKVKINACSRVTPFAFLPSLWLGPIWHQASCCPDGGHFSAPALAHCLPRLRVPVFRWESVCRKITARVMSPPLLSITETIVKQGLGPEKREEVGKERGL